MGQTSEGGEPGPGEPVQWVKVDAVEAADNPAGDELEVVGEVLDGSKQLTATVANKAMSKTERLPSSVVRLTKLLVPSKSIILPFVYPLGRLISKSTLY
jgi:hypothetical protein